MVKTCKNDHLLIDPRTKWIMVGNILGFIIAATILYSYNTSFGWLIPLGISAICVDFLILVPRYLSKKRECIEKAQKETVQAQNAAEIKSIEKITDHVRVPRVQSVPL